MKSRYFFTAEDARKCIEAARPKKGGFPSDPDPGVVAVRLNAYLSYPIMLLESYAIWRTRYTPKRIERVVRLIEPYRTAIGSAPDMIADAIALLRTEGVMAHAEPFGDSARRVTARLVAQEQRIAIEAHLSFADEIVRALRHVRDTGAGSPTGSPVAPAEKPLMRTMIGRILLAFTELTGRPPATDAKGPAGRFTSAAWKHLALHLPPSYRRLPQAAFRHHAIALRAAHLI